MKLNRKLSVANDYSQQQHSESFRLLFADRKVVQFEINSDKPMAPYIPFPKWNVNEKSNFNLEQK